MKDIRMILPNMASDTAGAASALFQADTVQLIKSSAETVCKTGKKMPVDVESYIPVQPHDLDLMGLIIIFIFTEVIMSRIHTAC